MKIEYTVLLSALVLLLLQPSTGNVLFRFSLGFNVDGDNHAETFNRTLIIDNNGITLKDNVGEAEVNDGGEGEKQEHISTVTASWEGLETEITAEASSASNVSDDDLERYNAVANEQLPAIRDAMTNLNNELVPLVGRNDEIAAKVKKINRHINELNAILALTNTQRLAKMQALDNFLETIDNLEHTEGHTNDVEKLLMQLLLSKHGLNELRAKVRNELNFIENKV